MKYFLIAIFSLLAAHSSYGDNESELESNNASTKTYQFSIPSHGSIADSLDKKAIKLGSSGHVKQAVDMLRKVSYEKTTLLISCRETLTLLAIEKALNIVSLDEVSALTIRVDKLSTCDADFIKEVKLKNISIE